MLAQIVNTVLGVWLMFAPAVLGHSGDVLATFDRGAGPWVASVSAVATSLIARSVRWLAVPAALVLVVAPWFVDAPGGSKANSILVGAIMLALIPVGRPDQRRYGNGWSTLWSDDQLPDWDASRSGPAADG